MLASLPGEGRYGPALETSSDRKVNWRCSGMLSCTIHLTEGARFCQDFHKRKVSVTRLPFVDTSKHSSHTLSPSPRHPFWREICRTRIHARIDKIARCPVALLVVAARLLTALSRANLAHKHSNLLGGTAQQVISRSPMKDPTPVYVATSVKSSARRKDRQRSIASSRSPCGKFRKFAVMSPSTSRRPSGRVRRTSRRKISTTKS